MSKINISEFDLKLGFNGKDVNKGLDKLEKRLQKMDKNISGAAKLAAQNAKIQNQLLKQKKALAMADLKIAKQKASLDQQNAKSDIARIRSAEAADRRRNARAIQRVRLATAENREAERARAAEAKAEFLANKRANAAERTARASERTRRNTQRTNKHLRDSLKFSGGLAGNLAKGALAFGATYGVTTAASSTIRAGVNYTRERTGLESVLEEIARKMNIADEKGFSRKYVQFAKQTALDMNRSITDTTTSLKNVLAANIGVITRGGQNSFDGVIDTFTGFTKAGAYSKSTKDEMRLMFRAITQSSQKGKLQAEEVTGQLAERSPFAMQALVRSFQKFKKDTTLIEKDFFKAMKNGELLAEDILPEAGRQIGFIIDDLTGSDLKKFLESSTAGTFAGLQTAVEGQQINIFDKMDKSLSRLLKSLSHFMQDMDWLTKPMGAYVGNILDYAEEDVRKIQRDMQNGKGFWGKLPAMFGIQDYQTFQTITNREGGATPEEQAAASKSLADSSRKFYDGVTDFGGGFLEGFTDTLGEIVSLVKELAVQMGLLEEGENWNPTNIGKVLGGLSALKFTGLINVLDKLITLMPMLIKFAANPIVMGALGVSGAGLLGFLLGSKFMQEDGVIDNSKKVGKKLFESIFDPSAELDRVAKEKEKKRVESIRAELHPNSYTEDGGLIGIIEAITGLNLEDQNLHYSNQVLGQGFSNYGNSHLNTEAKLLGHWDEVFNTITGESLGFGVKNSLFSDRASSYLGLTAADAQFASRNNPSSYGFSPDNKDFEQIKQAFLNGTLTIDINGDGIIDKQEVYRFQDIYSQGGVSALLNTAE